jgi:hypothetical protein
MLIIHKSAEAHGNEYSVYFTRTHAVPVFDNISKYMELANKLIGLGKWTKV